MIERFLRPSGRRTVVTAGRAGEVHPDGLLAVYHQRLGFLVPSSHCQDWQVLKKCGSILEEKESGKPPGRLTHHCSIHPFNWKSIRVTQSLGAGAKRKKTPRSAKGSE